MTHDPVAARVEESVTAATWRPAASETADGSSGLRYLPWTAEREERLARLCRAFLTLTVRLARLLADEQDMTLFLDGKTPLRLLGE